MSASESTGKYIQKQIFKNTYSKNHSGEETNDVTLIGKQKIQDVALLNWSKVVKIQDIAEAKYTNSGGIHGILRTIF